MTVEARASGPLVYMVAGEPSGDELGGRLMAALTRLTGGTIRFAGVGGSRMAAEGLHSLFPMSDLSVMGLFEVLPRIPRLMRRIRQVVADIERRAPEIVVTVDSPDFSFRVAARLHGSGIRLIHYVAPSVWAWRPERAAKMARLFDHVIALLPFEPPYFEREGLPCTFVGHPIVAEATRGVGARFRKRHDIPADAPLLAVLPGSRANEVRRLLPILTDTVSRLGQRVPNLRLVTAVVPKVSGFVRRAAAEWPVPVTIVEGADEKADAFAAANAAIAASGTVTLEVGIARTPMVVCYRLAALTAVAARWLIKIRFASLINLVLDREAVPELINRACTPERLAEVAEKLLIDRAAQTVQIASIERALAVLRGVDPTVMPSEHAARTVLAVIARNAGRNSFLGGEASSRMAETSGYRMLHTMIRVKDLDASLEFYTGMLGMRLLRKSDYPDGRFTLAFVGYGPEDSTAVLELTHNWDQEEPYDLGTGYGHVALGVGDIYKTCEDLKGAGGKVVREPGPMKHGTTVIAFIEDPDGYKIELIERS